MKRPKFYPKEIVMEILNKAMYHMSEEGFITLSYPLETPIFAYEPFCPYEYIEEIGLTTVRTTDFATFTSGECTFKLPFHNFIIEVATPEKDKDLKCFMILSEFSGELFIYCVMMDGENLKTCSLITLKAKKLFDSPNPPYVRFDGRIIRRSDGSFIDDSMNESLSETYALYVISEFLNLINSPSNIIAEVRGKPIQYKYGSGIRKWLPAVEHNIVIERSHGKSIKDGRAETQKCVIRAAHPRRAHIRLLKSDKFTNMKGNTVWVKESWVGPTEWKDSVGNTYSVKT